MADIILPSALLAQGMNSDWKYLLDGGLVVLIVVLIWTGMRSWTNNRNNRPD